MPSVTWTVCSEPSREYVIEALSPGFMPGPAFGFRHDFDGGSSDEPPPFGGAAA